MPGASRKPARLSFRSECGELLPALMAVLSSVESSKTELEAGKLVSHLRLALGLG